MLHYYHLIYLIENNITGKKYIGKHSTNNIDDSYFGGGVYLKRSIKKYGISNFSKKIIEFCDKSDLNKKEIYWISKMNTKNPNGYNLTNGGDGGDTYSLLNETQKNKFKEKSSRINKGKKFSEEIKQKMKKPKSESHKQKLKGPKSEEHKRRMKEAWIERRKNPVSEETREKIGNVRKGQKHQESSRNKIGQANSKRVWKEESKDKIRNSKLNSALSEETKRKIGIKHKCKYCESMMNAGNLARYHNENCKLKLIISQSASEPFLL